MPETMLSLPASPSFVALSRRRRTVVRDEARSLYIELGDARRMASQNLLRSEIRNRLETRAEFRSIIGSLLLGIAIRLAVALILYWLEQRLERPPLDYSIDEPGHP